MSLMLKLLTTTLLAGSFVHAADISNKVEDFLDDKFMQNPRLKSVDVKVSDVVDLRKMKNWKGYIVDVNATLNNKTKKSISQRMIWFSNGKVITHELFNLESGVNLIQQVKPKFKEAYYKKENLIFGHADAKHKVVIFSDPLCPFCRRYVPGALKNMKKDPNKYAVYYYHFPLERLHPASVTLVKAAAAARLQGHKDVVEKLYNVQVNSQERDVKKILAAFNKAEGTNIKAEDLKNPAVLKELKADFDTGNSVMVAGTPTVYFDGKIDRTRNKYLKAK